MESLFASLLNTVDRRSIDTVAHALGQPEQAVGRGMESCIAGLLGGLANKSGDPSALRRILDIIPNSFGAVSWSQMTDALADPNSSLVGMGKRLVPALFGSGENSILNGLSRASGLPLGATSTLLAMAGPVVMSFIGKQIRDGTTTVSGLASLLQKDSASIRNALPAGLSEIFWPDTARVSSASPVIAQAVQKERSPGWVLPVLATAAALALGLGWLLSHAHRPVRVVAIPVRPLPTGSASRLASTPNLTCTLPASIKLPDGGVESRLLTLVQTPDAKLPDTWFNMDQLTFDTGSSRLRPESGAQLDNIAAILTNCPKVHMTIAGHTDNVGAADANHRLAQSRANSVVAVLVGKGVSPDRLTAEAYGEDNPVADNSTMVGRAQNRRVAMRVTEK
jgi:outer membrane protein OmpA-like peptidoglycan-associated protein